MPSDYARLFIAFGYPVVLVFGVPAYLYFRRRNWLKVWQVTLAGAFAGALVPAAAVIFLWSSAPSAEHLFVATGRVGPFIPFGMAVGSVCAASFWLVALARVTTRQSAASRSAA